jgi:osmotically-inducible protein OsmY
MNNYCLGLWLLCCTLPVAAAGTQDKACTDPCLKAAITTLYIRSPFLNPFQLGISVEDSVVTIEGSVSDASESLLAEEIAGGVDGISAVVNRIRIAPPESAQQGARPAIDCLTDDATLVDRVKAQLYWNRATHGMTVSVSAKDGIVTLRGTAADAQQAELARLIALNTCGVKRVSNDFLTTTQEP